MTTTRYYLARGAGHGTPPAFAAAWAVTATAIRHLFVTDPTAGGTLATHNAAETVSGTTNVLAGQWLTAGMGASQVSGTFRLSLGVREGSGGVDGYVRIILRLVADDGTVRGTLADVEHATETDSVSSFPTRILGGVLAPLTAQAGDRIAVEIGHHHYSTDTTSRALNLMTGSVSASATPAADAPYVDGVATTTAAAPIPLRGWVELILDDPPQAPTGLVQTAATTNTVDVAWTAPAAGPVPDSYEIRINGGAPIDVGPGTSTVIPGLTPDTSYDVEVRSINTIGASAWHGPLEVTTIPEPSTEGYYRAAVEIGDHAWTAERGDTPGLGVALPLSFGWAIPDDALGYPAQPETATASLILVTATADDLADVDIDTPMRIRVWTSIDPAARPFATFVGRVADFEASPHDRGIAWRILAADYTVDLTARSVGSAEWPTESGDARAARIMAENGQTGWSTDPIGNTFEPRSAQAVSALAALVDTLTSAARYDGDEYDPPGRVILTAEVNADGLLEPTPYVGHFTAAQTNHIDTIDGSWVHRDSTWRRTRTMDGTWVHIEHPGGPTVYGKVTGPARPRIAVDVYDTDALADLVLASVPGYQWLSGNTLRLDLGADDVPAGYAVDWFWRDPDSPPVPWAGRLVVVEDINTLPGLFTRYAGMLAAARLVLEPGGRLVVDFRLRPDVPAHSTITPRWIDEPPTATWLDEPADATWFDLRTIDRLDYP